MPESIAIVAGERSGTGLITMLDDAFDKGTRRRISAPSHPSITQTWLAAPS